MSTPCSRDFDGLKCPIDIRCPNCASKDCPSGDTRHYQLGGCPSCLLVQQAREVMRRQEAPLSAVHAALRNIVYYSPFRIDRKDYEVFSLITSVDHYTEEVQRLYELAKKKIDRAIQHDLIEV